MFLDSSASGASSQLVLDSGWRALDKLTIGSASLAGVVDLARIAHRDGSDAASCLDRALVGCSRAQETAREVLQYLAGAFTTDRPRHHLFSAPELELWMVRSWSCLEDQAFGLFLQRFERALRHYGFGSKFPKALTQAFAEMIENIVRHGAPSGKATVGVAGYHVFPDEANFVVADLGRGVRASLQENPKWRDLPDDTSALLAAARDGATRLNEEEHGFGFKRVFKAFLEREGILALRSGEGSAVLWGNADKKAVETCSCAPAAGLLVSAAISTTGKARELPL